jgi:UDP-N-acetylmuramoyl-L-alanyl-D-glutamate--2,6-diaminopimelate ligase
MMANPSAPYGVSLAELLHGLCDGAQALDVDVTGLSGDSRAVCAGDAFFATRGLHVHGLAFVEQALEQGAVAVLWEPDGDPALDARAAALAVPALAVPGLGHKLGIIADRFYARPSADMQVIGVTGTDGKTSVTHYLAQALSQPGQPCGLLGTLGYGQYGTLQPATHTTPDALRLQAELAALRDRGVQQVAMEVSSHALHQHRSDGIVFHTAVLTHLSRDHLDYHGSAAAYAEAKRRLFEAPGLSCAVLNVDDPFGSELAERLLHRDVRVIAYQHEPATRARRFDDWLELHSVTALDKGIHLSLDSSRGAAQFEAPLLASFNADNLLAALGAMLAIGTPLSQCLLRLSRVSTVAGRMELFDHPGAPRVVVDYAHTPHALETALEALRPHCRGELVCVFGAGGDRDAGKRPHMGAVAERLADRVIVTSDNPRSEPPDTIIQQIVAGFREPRRARQIVDRAEAIETALREAAVDDLVLVAGKGHEDSQQVGSEQRPFSDRLLVRQLLQRLGE